MEKLSIISLLFGITKNLEWRNLIKLHITELQALSMCARSNKRYFQAGKAKPGKDTGLFSCLQAIWGVLA
jgi:hypothetical protein